MFSVGCGNKLKGSGAANGIVDAAGTTQDGGEFVQEGMQALHRIGIGQRMSKRVGLGEGGVLRRGSGITLRFGLLVFVGNYQRVPEQ